ncbi:redox-sensing transcriptional repressor Rex [Coriobacteriaceae bacterium EMTCatB1]|nr:redox-sensing transcriptional repressor Rex [Coriobacteriaceae bacterium EMTCatB1]
MSEKNGSGIPESTIERLPQYLRCLIELQALGVPLVKSERLAALCGTNAAQVRKDFSYLGELGTRGIGYEVAALVEHISQILGVKERRKAAIVGYGKLGAALHGYPGFPERGFEVVALFDVDPAKVGQVFDGLAVHHLDEAPKVLRELGVEIAILATPPHAAQLAADAVVEGGVKAILNLAPTRLVVPDDVNVRQVCLSTDLQILSFRLAQQEGAR